MTPPLREHPEDIPVLVRHFTRKWVAEVGRQILRIPSGTMHALVSWRWPGNVRELENFIARSVILSIGSSLCAPLTEITHRVRVRVLANTIAGQTPTPYFGKPQNGCYAPAQTTRSDGLPRGAGECGDSDYWW